MNINSMHFHSVIAGAWDQGVIGAASENAKYSAPGRGRILQHSLLTIINHIIQCTNTNTDDAGNA